MHGLFLSYIHDFSQSACKSPCFHPEDKAYRRSHILVEFDTALEHQACSFQLSTHLRGFCPIPSRRASIELDCSHTYYYSFGCVYATRSSSTSGSQSPSPSQYSSRNGNGAVGSQPSQGEGRGVHTDASRATSTIRVDQRTRVSITVHCSRACQGGSIAAGCTDQGVASAECCRSIVAILEMLAGLGWFLLC